MKIVIGIISFGILANILLILSLIYQDQINEQNEDISQSLQLGQAEFTNWIQKIISEISLNLWAFLVLLDFSLWNRTRGLWGIFGFFFSLGVTSILKMAIADPRPFWVSQDVQAISCSQQWSNPSGHSLITATLVSFYMLFLNWRWSPVWFIDLAVVTLNRVYLGVHTIWQVILGYLIGFCLGFSLYLLYEKDILNKIYNDWKLHLFFHSGLILVVLIPLIIYYAKDAYWSQQWEDNYEEKCDSQLNQENQMRLCAISSSYIFIASGAFLLFSFAKQRLLLPESQRQKAVFILFCIIFAGFYISSAYVVDLIEEFLLALAVQSIIGFGLGSVFSYIIPYFSPPKDYDKL